MVFVVVVATRQRVVGRLRLRGIGIIKVASVVRDPVEDFLDHDRLHHDNDDVSKDKEFTGKSRVEPLLAGFSAC